MTGAAVGRGEPSAAELAEVALGHPAVVRLHPGRYREVGTYLPGRRIAGVRVTADEVEIHLVVALGVAVHRVAEEVRAAVRPLVGALPVHIVIGDLAGPETETETETETGSGSGTGPSAAVHSSGSSQVDGR